MAKLSRVAEPTRVAKTAEFGLSGQYVSMVRLAKTARVDIMAGKPKKTRMNKPARLAKMAKVAKKRQKLPECPSWSDWRNWSGSPNSPE